MPSMVFVRPTFGLAFFLSVPYNTSIMKVINFYKNLPQTPGVFLMKNAGGGILYIGKAANLKRRVSSYFLRSHDARIETVVDRIRKIDFIKTNMALKALILE